MQEIVRFELTQISDQVVVSEHDALGQTGGARGVRDHQHVALRINVLRPLAEVRAIVILEIFKQADRQRRRCL